MDRTLGLKTFAEGDLEAFHRRVDGLHSWRGRVKRDTLAAIMQRAAQLAGMSDYAFMRATTSTLDVVPDSAVCSVEEWDALFTAIEARSDRIAEEELGAKETLSRKMSIVSAGRDVRSELAPNGRPRAEMA